MSVQELVTKNQKNLKTLESGDFREEAREFVRKMGKDPDSIDEVMLVALEKKMEMEAGIEDVVLTEEEERKVLEDYKRKLKMEKLARDGALREKKYWEGVWRSQKEEKLSADQLWRYVKTHLPTWFEVDKWNVDQIRKLSLYFTEDKKFEEMGDGYSLEKGLMLYGPHGCGKTALIQAFQVNPRRGFQVRSAVELDGIYQNRGVEGLSEFVRWSELGERSYTAFRQSEGTWCFDDLGHEKDMVSHYGDKLNVMDYLLRELYYRRKSMPFHITTNMGSQKMSERYGFLAGSGRMKEMFNLIWFSKHAPNRRG